MVYQLVLDAAQKNIGLQDLIILMITFSGNPYRILDVGSFLCDWCSPVYANSSKVQLKVFKKITKSIFYWDNLIYSLLGI